MNDKKMELISIIIPAYNIKRYLSECLDSIIMQTYTNIEIILIDDGSTDGTADICDQYADKDNRITVIHQNNIGSAASRNVGIDFFTGEYVTFIDGDDILSRRFIERLFIAIRDRNADIAECNAYYLNNNNVIEYNTDVSAMYETNHSIMEAYLKDYLIKTVIWNKLYKKSIIKGTKFVPGKFIDDEFFSYKVLAKAKRLVHIDEYLYYYRQHADSIMGQSRKYSLKNLDALEGCATRALFVKEHYPDLYVYELLNMTNACISHYKMILQSDFVDTDNKAIRVVCAYKRQFSWDYCNFMKISFKDKLKVFLSSVSLEGYARLDLLLKKVRHAE